MNIFNPDSKFMYYLGITGDLIILNVLFAICCIPVFTIGAAQAGLYTGLRNVLDRDSGNTPSKSFFRGFKNGFGKITVVWIILLLCILILCYSVYFIYLNKLNAKFTAIIAIVGAVLLLILATQAFLFHSRFDCTKMQLIRNSIIMMFANPLKSIIITALAWFPILLLLLNEYFALLGTPLWLGIYYSFAFLLNASLMKKSFNRIIYPDGVPEETESEEENNE